MDSSSETTSPTRSTSYPKYLSPTWDKDTQWVVVWTRLQEHRKLANHSLACINEQFRALHQEIKQTQVKSSHELFVMIDLLLLVAGHWESQGEFKR